MPPANVPGISVSVYRALLLLYPTRHRREYGSLMAQLFRDQMVEARTRSGVRGVLHIWARTLRDLLLTVPREHMAAVSKPGLLRAGVVLLVVCTLAFACFRVGVIPARALVRAGDQVLTVALSPDGRTLVTGSLGGGMQVWDIDTRQRLHTLVQHHMVFGVAVSPDGKWLASGGPCGSQGCVQLWDANSGQLVHTIGGHARGVQMMDREGHMQVADLPGDVGEVCFSPDGGLLASASSDGAIELWDISSGQPVQAMVGHSGMPVGGIAFSPDGRTLASSQAGVVLLWDVSSGHLVRELEHDRVGEVAFSPDGHTLASGGFDEMIRLWDAYTGQLLQNLEQDSRVSSLAFSPDGQILASGGWDNRIRLWDLESGKLVRTYRGHQWDPFDNGVTDLAFSSNGRLLASAGEDGWVILWNVPGE